MSQVQGCPGGRKHLITKATMEEGSTTTPGNKGMAVSPCFSVVFRTDIEVKLSGTLVVIQTNSLQTRSFLNTSGLPRCIMSYRLLMNLHIPLFHSSHRLPPFFGSLPPLPALPFSWSAPRSDGSSPRHTDSAAVRDRRTVGGRHGPPPPAPLGGKKETGRRLTRRAGFFILSVGFRTYAPRLSQSCCELYMAFMASNLPHRDGQVDG